jgi:hypothetical protein
VPTTAETEITVIVHHTQISGVQPSIGGLSGKVRRSGKHFADSGSVRLVDL